MDWPAQGVRLGQSRNYCFDQANAVFAPDTCWDKKNCSPGGFAYPSGVPGTVQIRMTEAYAAYAAQCPRDRGYRLDLLYNAGFGKE